MHFSLPPFLGQGGANLLYGVRVIGVNRQPEVALRDMEMDMSHIGVKQLHMDGGNERHLK